MDHAAVAKKIREAIFDHAESEGRVIQDSIDGVIEGVLRKEAPGLATWYGGLLALQGQLVTFTASHCIDGVDVGPGTICWVPLTSTDDEYR